MNRKTWNVTDKRYVCFLDIMGFKDMVMKNQHEFIYKKLEVLSNYTKSLETQNLPSGYEPDSLKTVSFSDSIVIFTKNDNIKCLEILTYAVCWLFSRAVVDEIPLKGAISHGEMSVNISRQIFFGQPLIDAYLLEEELSFYGVVLHNTVEKIMNSNYATLNCIDRFIDCSIPLKTGKNSHYVLNWLDDIQGENHIDKKNNAISFIKKQRYNTSGYPRKYIDNTIELITSFYPDLN